MTALDRLLAADLARIEERDLLRVLRTFADVQAAHVTWNGRRYLLCASNNYLGLAHDSRVLAAAGRALTYGAGATGSRLTTGHTVVHEQLETDLAAFKRTQAALVFSSGYLANLGVLSALAGPDDAIFSDALNHASLIDGCRLSRAHVFVYRHVDMEHLRALLSESGRWRRRFVVTDGVFSMDGDVSPLRELVDLCEAYDAHLIVDDAHGTGVLGEGGRGAVEAAGVAHDRIAVQIGTLSKALGAEGGFVVGSRVLIDYLANAARPFVFNTGLAPAACGAAAMALTLVVQEPDRRARLHALAQRLRTGLLAIGCNVICGDAPIVPLLIGSASAALEMQARLLATGIFAPAIRPPTVPDGTARIRFTLTAEHSESDVDAIIAACRPT
jgi:8-amino-7-oxononanoate synthase